ncbi:diguanylate cyclase domain-containing protein [Actinoplanes sp. NPDC049265]|uniref:diguanylate cyclase domain-containing protein n=1 Tax=Actinoplanes sp. NPDC049265 TaxID=3363902 RepID=UPI00372256EB
MGMVPGTTRSSRPGWLVMGIGLVAIALFTVAGDGASVVFLLVIVASIVATATGIRWNQPPGQRRPWLALVASQLCFCASVILPRPDRDAAGPLETIANAAEIGGYVLLAVALTLLLRQRRLDRDDPGRVDALLVVLAAALMAWTLFIEPALGRPGDIGFAQLTDVVGSALDVVAIVASAQLIQAGRGRTPAFWILGLALTAVFGCDLLFALIGTSASTFVEKLLSALVLAGFLGMAVASLHPTVRQVSRPQPVALRRLGPARTVWLTALMLLPVVNTTLWPPRTALAGQGRVVLSLLLTVTVIVRIVRHTNARIQRELQARRRAAHDDLTGLPNRAGFYEELNRVADEPNRRVALLVIDLNDFKQTNDTYGHQAGDAVLVAFGALLRANIRAGEMAARLGGDEFAVLLDVDAVEDAVSVAERILWIAAAQRVPVGAAHTAISCSIGIAMTDSADSGRLAMNEIIHRADLAMYAAKRQGRGGWQTYVTEEAEPAAESAPASRQIV